MHRREFVTLSASGIALALVPFCVSSCDSRSKWSDVLAMPSMLGRFCSTEELKKIGSVYLQNQKEEASEDTLEEKLLILSDRKLFEPASAGELQNHLMVQTQNDFLQDDTMIIDGWVISRTEARQCALYALINS